MALNKYITNSNNSSRSTSKARKTNSNSNKISRLDLITVKNLLARFLPSKICKKIYLILSQLFLNHFSRSSLPQWVMHMFCTLKQIKIWSWSNLKVSWFSRKFKSTIHLAKTIPKQKDFRIVSKRGYKLILTKFNKIFLSIWTSNNNSNNTSSSNYISNSYNNNKLPPLVNSTLIFLVAVLLNFFP